MAISALGGKRRLDECQESGHRDSLATRLCDRGQDDLHALQPT